MIIKSKHWNQTKNFFSSKKRALAQQIKETQQRCDEMGQYRRRLYQRIDSVPNQNNEKAEGFFEFVKRSHWRNSRPWYAWRCTRQTHRIGSDFTYKKVQKLHKSICPFYDPLSSSSILQSSEVKRNHTAKFCFTNVACQMKINE